MDSQAQNFYVGSFREKGRSDADVDEFDLVHKHFRSPLEGSVVKIARKFAYSSDVNCCAISNDDEMVAIGGSARSVWMYSRMDNQSAKPVVLLKVPYPSKVEAIAFARPMTLSVGLPLTASAILKSDALQAKVRGQGHLGSVDSAHHHVNNIDGSVTFDATGLKDRINATRDMDELPSMRDDGDDDLDSPAKEHSVRHIEKFIQRNSMVMDDPINAGAEEKKEDGGIDEATGDGGAPSAARNWRNRRTAISPDNDQGPGQFVEIVLNSDFVHTVMHKRKMAKGKAEADIVTYALLNGPAVGEMVWSIMRDRINAAADDEEETQPPMKNFSDARRRASLRVDASEINDIQGKRRLSILEDHQKEKRKASVGESGDSNPFDSQGSPEMSEAAARVAARRGSAAMHDQKSAEAGKHLIKPTKRQKLKVGQKSVVMIVGVVERSIQMGSVHLGIVESGGATYDIDVTLFTVEEWQSWRPYGRKKEKKNKAKQLPKSRNAIKQDRILSATKLSVGTKVVVVGPAGLVTQYGSKNVLAVGGEQGTVIVSSFMTGVVQGNEEEQAEQEPKLKRGLTASFGRASFGRAGISKEGSGLGSPGPTSGGPVSLMRSLAGMGALHQLGENMKDEVQKLGTMAENKLSLPGMLLKQDQDQEKGEEMSAAAAAVRDEITEYLPESVTGQKLDVEVFEISTGAKISSVSLSADGGILAVGSANKEVLIIDTNPFKQEIIQRLPTKDSVMDLAISQRGERVAIGGADHTVAVLDVATGCELFQLRCGDRVGAVALSSYGRLVACGGFDKKVRLCNTESGVTMHAFPVKDPVRGIAFSDDSRRLAIGGDDKTSRVYDTASRACIRKWEHTNTVWTVALSHDGGKSVSGDYDGRFLVRDVDEDECLFEFKFKPKAGPPFIWSVAITPDGKRVAGSSWNGEVRVWNVSLGNDWELACPVIRREDRVFSIALAKAGTVLAVADRTGKSSVYNLIPNKDDKMDTCKSDLEVVFPNRVYTVALTRDGELFAIGGIHKEVWVYNLRSHRRIRALPREATIQSLAFTLDGTALAAGGEDKTVTVWDTKAEYEIKLILPRGQMVHSVAFSNDSLGFAVGPKAVMYGGGGTYQYSWRDRPDFEVVSELLDSPRALQTMLYQHTSTTNAWNPQTGESVMQRVVRLHTNNVLKSMLNANPAHVGFFEDKLGHTALKMSLLLEKRKSANMLIDAVTSGRVLPMPSSLASVTECFSLLNRTFPELLLNLVTGMPLDREPEMLFTGGRQAKGAAFAQLAEGEKLVRGSRKRTEPRNLWHDILMSDDDQTEENNTHKAARAEVVALRVPFQNFAGRYENFDDSPLHIVTVAAQKLNKLEVASRS